MTTDPLLECRDENGKLDLEKVADWEAIQNAAQVAAAGDVAIIQESLFSLQVCARAELTAEQVKEITNRIHYCGTTAGWEIDEQPPVTCEADGSRRHWALVC